MVIPENKTIYSLGRFSRDRESEWENRENRNGNSVVQQLINNPFLSNINMILIFDFKHKICLHKKITSNLKHFFDSIDVETQE